MTSSKDLEDIIKKVSEEIDSGEVDDLLIVSRQIVNIERQSFYGGESSHKRLQKIRDVIAQSIELRGS